jgi:hypothetical protein
MLLFSLFISLAIGGWDLMVVSAVLLGYRRMAIGILSLLVPPTTVAPFLVLPWIGIVMGLMGFASFFGFGMAGVLDPSYRFLNASVRGDYAWMVIVIFLGLFMLLPPLLSITYWLPTYLSDAILIAYSALQGAYAIGSAYAIKLLIS